MQKSTDISYNVNCTVFAIGWWWPPVHTSLYLHWAWPLGPLDSLHPPGNNGTMESTQLHWLQQWSSGPLCTKQPGLSGLDFWVGMDTFLDLELFGLIFDVLQILATFWFSTFRFSVSHKSLIGRQIYVTVNSVFVRFEWLVRWEQQ